MSAKQVAILVDELELMDLTMGLMRLEDHWLNITREAVELNEDSGYIATCSQVVNAIVDLKAKLNTIKEEQFK